MKPSSLRSCRDISALLLAREDRNLRWPERMAIRVHFLMCKACPRFERQILTMRSALGQWRAYRDDGDA
ncbi:MAG: zf-HC2 domain-containing protein [Betaproteobacteria bacterium]|nr:zf-HC2 domain-containing protein [Betaproteobacteria bacterium]MBU6512890.1 zf-HC2 domain-containing protein [Betaproteobacteria bacterium]MDE1955726.1 zf-HC2 domain-containing protein [Betaproteobacteria bacterium]MDE2154088.1 zf-HC2 domain-containing protein [Betaproteobacteria bacterium]MDE2478589.1 zf-HC2 domain-containing protein [Betaproteobacteria bacterium]